MRFRVWVLLLLCVFAGGASAATRPNIVLVITDDHGWPDYGFMGHDLVQTPVIDRLAAEGTVFTHAQLPASHCRPTLQTFLSGLHPVEWATKTNAIRRTHSVPARTEARFMRTLPRELARVGYRSWEGGKMWEGSFRDAGFDGGTAQRALGGPFEIDGVRFGREGWEPERCGFTRTLDEPCPALAPMADFLDATAGRPFFLWFAPALPHTPFDPPLEFLLPYAGAEGRSPAELVYYAQITRLDALVGELLRELERRDLARDTLLVFVADNGWKAGAPPVPGHTSGKTALDALGMRTPLVFHWPGRVPRGVVRDDIVVAEDLFPTLLDFAGAEPLPDRRGRSLLPAIATGRDAGRDHYVSFYRDPQGGESTGFFVRTPEWRYLRYLDGRESLYAIREDPFERVDLSASRRALMDEMLELVLAWGGEVQRAPDRLEIAGRVSASGGAPLRGVAVRLEGEGSDLQVLTDASGQFRFQNLPHGRYRLREGPGLLILVTREEGVRLPLGRVGSFDSYVALPEPGLRRAGRAGLTGRLRTLSGAGIDGVPVTVRELIRGLEVRVLTGPDGRYLAENLPFGRYHVDAVLPEGLRARPIELDVVDARLHDRDLVVRSAPL